MNKDHKLLPIGVFDSGIGGISVLSEMLRLLPNEQYIYIADSANAPYGTKSCECVRNLSLNIAKLLVSKGIKALVVACNTATSAAIANIREQYSMPVIGMEPALKPAVENGKNGKIIVMATPLTLKEAKFNSLVNRYKSEAAIVPLPCSGLVELIEAEDEQGIRQYLQKLFQNIALNEVSSVVLGCTHYCFIKNELQKVIGSDIQIIDGNTGAVRHLQRTLKAADLINNEQKPGPVEDRVEYIATGQDRKTIELCKRFLDKYMFG